MLLGLGFLELGLSDSDIRFLVSIHRFLEVSILNAALDSGRFLEITLVRGEK